MPSEPAPPAPGFPLSRGKVRDVYDLGDTLVLVASDRISAFDHILPTPIPGKGAILTRLTKFWLGWLGVPNHYLSDDPGKMPPVFRTDSFHDRTMLVRKAAVVPFECVVRGYLAGSGWKEYAATGTVCGVPLPPGLAEGAKLPEPIFTPATKAEQGAHDENVPFEVMAGKLGSELAGELRAKSLDIYARAHDYALGRGVVIADTKFEWGLLPNGEVILIDEVLTPDSSRFWPLDPAGQPDPRASFDKQFVRDWLLASGWDRESEPPELPADVVAATAGRYAEALARLGERGASAP